MGFKSKCSRQPHIKEGKKEERKHIKDGKKKHIKDGTEQRQLQCAEMGMTHWTDRQLLYHSLHGLRYLNLWIKIIGFVD